jgi:hypothetical protein
MCPAVVSAVLAALPPRSLLYEFIWMSGHRPARGGGAADANQHLSVGALDGFAAAR